MMRSNSPGGIVTVFTILKRFRTRPHTAYLVLEMMCVVISAVLKLRSFVGKTQR